jgi:C4-dicarboxylate-specific signal transduction histidine kinase
MQRAELAHDARVRTLGEIATGVAHELNQPLTAIANYAESCAHAISGQDLDHRDKLLTWLEQITNSTQRAAEMIRRLRRFARKSGPRRSAVDVNELVQEVIDLLEAEARLQNIRIRWQSVAATQARIDRVQVQQVLVNLLRNAFEAMCDNPSDRRQVTIKAKAGAEGIELSVEDLGKGVAAEDVDRVFEAFFTTKPNGLGIGLAISRSIIEDHRGRLWVDSGRRGGAVFHFTLPLEGATDGAVAEGSGRR